MSNGIERPTLDETRPAESDRRSKAGANESVVEQHSASGQVCTMTHRSYYITVKLRLPSIYVIAKLLCYPHVS